MALPRLEDLDAILNRTCADVLGDLIGYRAVGATVFASLPAHVDYRDEVQDLGNASAIAQDIAVEMLIADVPVRPNANVRIKLPRRAGHVFKPVKVRMNEGGDHWMFDLKDVTT